MFLYFYGGHVCVPPKGHKNGVSIQSSINLGKTLLRITRELKTAETYIYHLSYPLFVTLFIEWLQFLDLIT